METDNEVEVWHAMRATYRRELEAMHLLEKANIGCFIPMQYKISICRGRKVRALVPVIRNLVFVHTTKQTACDLSNVYGVRLFYMKDLSTHSMLVVPDKQMEDFMFVMDLNPDGVSLNSEILTVGHKVKVIKGEFSGIEGEVAIEANKTYVVIRIKDLLTQVSKSPNLI